MSEQAARMRFVTEMARLTVWIRQRSDGRWEAIDWEGKVLSSNKNHGLLHREIHAMAGVEINRIWAITTVIAPNKRRPHAARPTRRSL